MRSSLELSFSARAAGQYVPYLRRILRAAHALLRSPLRELSVALVGDSAMSALHKRFMNDASPTDVLTFPLELDARSRPVAGEVVVCVPEARRRAKEFGNSLDKELLLYALHGMLHLCGFDDRTARAFARMHRMEDTILSRLGVGPVFRPDRPQSSTRARSQRRQRPARQSRRAVARPKR